MPSGIFKKKYFYKDIKCVEYHLFYSRLYYFFRTF